MKTMSKKYTGHTQVLDERGEVVFTRELAAEEIIEALLPQTLFGVPVIVTKEPPVAAPAKRHYKKRDKGAPEKLPKTSRKSGRFSGHECCGSQGARHKKDCPMNRPAGKSRNAHLVADRKTAFSAQTYATVKKMLETEGVDFVAREKGLDVDEIRRANLADDYQEYLRIA